MTLKSSHLKNWYVFSTFPKSEKIVLNSLIRMEFEVFLPTIRTLRIWKNRQRVWLDQILFPGYIFVFTFQSSLYSITSLPKIISYLKFEGIPATVPNKEIEAIKRVICLEHTCIEKSEYCIGEKVKVIGGPLAGYDGVLISKNGKERFGIQINAIGQTLLVEINTSYLEGK